MSENSSVKIASGVQINLYYLVTVLFWGAMYTYTPTMTRYLKSEGVDYAMIGLIGGSYGFTQMLLRIPLGILSDRIGKRKLFVIFGVFFSALSSLLMYLADSPLLFLFGRALSGVAASAWVVISILFSSYFSEDKAASRMSFLMVFNCIGQMSAILIGGIVAGYLGLRFPFLLGAFVGVAGLIMSFFVKENVPPSETRPTFRALLSVAGDKNLMTMSILSILTQIVLFGTTNTFTPEIASELGATTAELGYVSTVATSPRIVSALICGILFTKKTDAKKLIALSFLLQAIGTFLTPFSPNLGVLYAASIISGFGSGIAISVFLSLCTLTVEADKRSAAMGFYQAIYGIGMFAGPVLVGFFAQNLSMVWGFTFAALIAVIGIVGSLKFVRI